MTRPPRLQVVVAHPDDETFGCGSLLLHAAGLGMTTAVCCATRGEEGGTEPGLGAIREAELHTAAKLLNVSRVTLLGFGDSAMSGEPPPGSLLAAPMDRVVRSVAEELDRFEPDIVVTLDASDGHRDHVRMRDATIVAAADAGIPTVYLNCLPRSLMRRWVDEMRQQRPDMEHLNADTAGLGTPDDEITTVIDATEHLVAREQAMTAHASQTSPYDGLSGDLREAFLRDVRLRRIVPEWPGGPVRTALEPFGDALAVP